MKRTSSIPRHLLAWVALWIFWVFVSRHNHPSWLLNAAATTFLVATFALAVYANHLVLIPGFLRRGRIAAYLAGLLSVTIVLALLCTLAISLAYDILVGPDPRRFSFGANFAMEFAGVALHVAAVATVVRLRTWIRTVRTAGVMESDLLFPGGDDVVIF